MFSKVLVVLAVITLSSCALFEDRKGPETAFAPRQKIFVASFDEVWRAANLVLQPYPLRVSNMDQGLLETDFVRGAKVWTPPFKTDQPSGGEAYKLTIKIAKGSYGSQHATRVSILKDNSIQHDFFSDAKPLPSDGLEEKTLLYRIGREIQTERALARAQKKQNKG